MTIRFFRARLAKAAPYIGVKMWHGSPLIDGLILDRSPRMQVVIGAEITGRAVTMLGTDDIPVEVDGVMLRAVEPVTEAEWAYLVAHQAWAAEHAPNHPKSEPRQAVDFNKILPF
jgi:hypothetical protein